MSAITQSPQTQDFLSPLGFQFSILKAPAINFFVQSVDLPSIDLGEAQIPTPFSTLKFAGTRLSYGDLSVTYKVDEKLESYLEIHNWMKRLGFPDEFSQYSELLADNSGVDTPYSDLSLIILSNQKNPKFHVTYKDAFPMSLGPLTFDATAADVDYLTVTARFAYRSYDIVAIT